MSIWQGGLTAPEGRFSTPWTFTVTSKPVQDVQGMQFRGYNCDGWPHLAWSVQDGIDWYQIHVTSGGAVVLSQWFNMSYQPPGDSMVQVDRNAGLPMNPRTANLYLKLNYPLAGPMEFWIRTYTHSGQFSEWVGLPAAQGFDSSVGPGISTIPDNDGFFTLDWSDSTDVGQYEIYVQREGQLYFTKTITCTNHVGDPRGPGWAGTGTIESEWTPYFRFCPGNYSIWIRNVCGTSATPWTGPRTFTVTLPPQG